MGFGCPRGEYRMGTTVPDERTCIRIAAPYRWGRRRKIVDRPYRNRGDKDVLGSKRC